MNVIDIIKREIDEIANNIEKYIDDYCIPCHFITRIARELNIGEADAADLLSNTLHDDAILSEKFIEVVELVHMKARMKAINFYNRKREDKDRYLSLYIKNALDELKYDISNYGKEIALRKLLLNHFSTYLAQTLGIDLHLATEELYYLLRKEKELEDLISEFINRLNND
ncbi:MAG: hypothetical protein QW416_06280 [Candidatus Nitrosocaldaceae archaeon]